jgi:hypothetical protein
MSNCRVRIFHFSFSSGNLFVRVVHPCHCTMPSVCLCCAPLSLYYTFSLSVLCTSVIVLPVYLQLVRVVHPCHCTMPSVCLCCAPCHCTIPSVCLCCAPMSLYYAFSLSVLCTPVIVLYIQFVCVIQPYNCTISSVCPYYALMSLYYTFSLFVR